MCTIRAAEPGDIDRLMGLLYQAVEFMYSRGNTDQWNHRYPDRDMILRDISTGHCYTAVSGNEIHGFFCLVPGIDPTYLHIENGAWPDDRPYATLHRVVGDGTIRHYLDKVVAFALERHDVIRADTHKDNLVMQNALLRNGFVYCGIIYIADGTPRLAYQLNKSRAD